MSATIYDLRPLKRNDDAASSWWRAETEKALARLNAAAMKYAPDAPPDWDKDAAQYDESLLRQLTRVPDAEVARHAATALYFMLNATDKTAAEAAGTVRMRRIDSADGSDSPEDDPGLKRERFQRKAKAKDAPKPDGEEANGHNDDVERELLDLQRRIVAAPDLARYPEPRREWIVEGVVPDKNLTLFTGPGGDGKTTLAMQLAAAMQIDGEWLGMKVQQGAALFLTSEDDLDDANLQLRSILKNEGKSLAHCPGLHVLSLADRDACLAAAPTRTAALAATPLWRAIEILVERIKPRVVIFDALADLFGGEENFRRHVRGFIVLLKRLAISHKLAVILIAHPSQSGMNSGTGLSGSTDWHNGPRARLYLQRPKDKDGKPIDRDLRTLSVLKAQFSDEQGTVFRLLWRSGAFVYQGKDGSASFDRAASAAKAETVFLTLLHAFEEQDRRVSPNPGANYAPTVFENEPDAESVTKAALKRAMSKLLKDNRIHVIKTGPPSRALSKLTPGPAPAKSGETMQ